MGTEKRLLIFLVLSLVILFAFHRLFTPQVPQELVNQTRELPSQEAFSPQETLPPTVVKPRPGPAQELKTTTFESEDYILTICTTGGYVKELQIKKYNERLLYYDLLVLPQYLDKEFRLEETSQGFRLIYDEESGQVVKEIKFRQPFLLDILVKNSLENVQEIGLFKQASDTGFYKRYQELFYGKDQLTRINFSKIKGRRILSYSDLFGARDRYYAAVIFNSPEGDYILSKENSGVLVTWDSTSSLSSFEASLFLGPQDMKTLRDNNLQNIINFGFFHGIGMVILKVLHFFFSIFKNWGVSIIAISTLIYFGLFPLTAKSTKSIKRMQELQPMIEEIRKKHKDNPQKLNKEVLQLYKEYKVNPVGGCLPMFLQIPIFFTLYQVLNRSVEIKGAGFLWIKDLSHPDYLIRFPSSWPKLPVIGDGFHLLPIIMLVIMVLQQKLTTPQGQSSEQQKLMTTFMPIVFGVIFYNFPSGLVLYWLCNSLFTFLYQLRLMKVKSA